jgi:hypothetical protein
MAPRERQLVRPYWDAFWHFNYYDYRDSDAEWYYLDSQRYGHAHHPVGGLALKGQTKSPPFAQPLQVRTFPMVVTWFVPRFPALSDE